MILISEWQLVPTSVSTKWLTLRSGTEYRVASPRTKNPDSRGFDSGRYLVFKGWNSWVHGDLPMILKSDILSLRTLSLRSDRIKLDGSLSFAAL